MEGKREEGQGRMGKREEAQGMEGKSKDGHGRKGSAKERVTYGPLDIRRYLKDNGRALILYTLRERGDC